MNSNEEVGDNEEVDDNEEVNIVETLLIFNPTIIPLSLLYLTLKFVGKKLSNNDFCMLKLFKFIKLTNDFI